MKTRIAIVDDAPRMTAVLSMLLASDEREIVCFNASKEFVSTLPDTVWDLVLTDLRMPEMDGAEVLAAVKDSSPDTPVILITAHATIETAVGAIKSGAFDYVQKPFDNKATRALVERALEFGRLARENRRLRAAVRHEYGLDNFVAESEAMRAALNLARRAARSNATVLITGASGTGKEVVARAIHYYSERVGAPFVAVNCKAYAAGVLESELFGHAKGAFTGADRDRLGVFERAEGGTILLDEIGEIDDAFQAKLLRVLQEREVLPVGADRPRKVDVRVLVATHRDLQVAVASGRFREDLYYRIAVIPILLPPLKDRPADVLPLARHFLARFTDAQGRSGLRLSPDGCAALVAHQWPGNVRELENVIERAVVLSVDDELGPHDLMLPTAAEGERAGTLAAHLDLAARTKIQVTLRKNDGRRQDAAAELGIDRTTLYRLMKKFGVDG